MKENVLPPKAGIRQDLLFAIILSIAIGLFLPFPFLKSFHQNFLYNTDYWYITYFLKFFVLATLGECLGLRISKKLYFYKGFGILPRAFVWGFLGITIGIAFIIFAEGTPPMLAKFFGLSHSPDSMSFASVIQASKAGFLTERIITAVAISTALNLFFAPVFMTFHKITDTHILQQGGTLKGLFKAIPFAKIFSQINWDMQWGFIFKKTIPFFWIPIQSITFLMAPQYRVAFAAFLGVVLGVILAFANAKSK